VFALGAGAGLILALTLMASIREKLQFATVPAIAKGAAIIFIVAGGLSLAFMGFAGLLSGG
jgi:Predicted NADH:ubiquinone oxidoreductase, subunit RnfA